MDIKDYEKAIKANDKWYSNDHLSDCCRYALFADLPKLTRW